MSSPLTPLELLVKETRHAFIVAKADGVLNAGEVIQIAVELAQKIQKVGALTGSEKKAMLLMALNKGLEASGGLEGLPGMVGASNETKQAFQDSLMMAASTAVDMLLSAASGKLDLRKPSNWKALLPMCCSAVQALIPKDQALLKEAAKYSEKILNKATDDDASLADIAATVVTDVKTDLVNNEAVKAVVMAKAAEVINTVTKTMEPVVTAEPVTPAEPVVTVEPVVTAAPVEPVATVEPVAPVDLPGTSST